MKHLFNNISEEEKNRIREQHTGGMKIATDKFKKLVETKQGNVKLYLNEQSNNNSICDYFISHYKDDNDRMRGGIDEGNIYGEHMDTGASDQLNWENAGGKTPWLFTKGLSIFPSGDYQKAYEAAKELYDGISGLDVTGVGAMKIAHVGKMWETFDLPTQNEFLKQWYIISKGTETPWEAIVNDYENDIRDKMWEDSREKVMKFCTASLRN